MRHGLVGIAAGLLLAVSVLSCSRGAVNEQEPPRQQFDRAMEYYNNGKYFKAQMALKRLTFSFPGQTFIDTAQFYLGKSLYELENYPEAVGEFRRLLTAYPSSPFADDALYHIAMCHYSQSPKYSLDQEETFDAIDEFSSFISRYPKSPLQDDAAAKLLELYDKLAKKMFKNGELYLKTHDYEQAVMYFEQVRDNYPNTEWARYALYYTGEALLGLERDSDALETFQNFVMAFPEHKLTDKARKNIARLQADEAGG